MRKLKKFVSKIDSANLINKIRMNSQPTLSFIMEHADKAWIGGVAMMGDLSQQLSKTDFVSSLNDYKSAVSQAMDAGFVPGKLDLETGRAMMANNHRILDGGHTFFESIQKAKEVGEAHGWSDAETFGVWFKSYFTDLSSPAGMPAFGKATDDVYHLLRKMGLDEAVARDIVTVNGQEAIEALFGGTLAAISLILAWRNEDKENFSKAIGSLGLAGLVSINPAVLVIVIVAAALGYNSLVCHKAVTKGAILSTTFMVTSALIPGPVLLGVIFGVVFAAYLNKKMGKDFDPTAQFKAIFETLMDPVKRDKLIADIEKMLEEIRLAIKESRSSAA